MNIYCKNLLNLYRFGNRHCSQKITRVIRQINWPTSTSTEIKRYLFTSPKCLIARWVIMNDDGWQESSSPYFIVLPNVPKETAENNLFLESIEFKRDWPPLGSATPEEFYQGTVKLLMELSTTFSEQIEILEGELNKQKLTFPFTFDTILSRPMEEYYFASYAFKTLKLKMLTDWPECARMDWQKDIEAIIMLVNDELVERMYDTIIAEAVKKIPYDELDKLDPWTKRFVDFLKQEWIMAGLEHDTIKNKRDKKQQELNTFVLAIEIFKHCRLFYLCILFEAETSKVEVKITDREQLKNAPQKVLKLLAGNNDAENGPWTAKTTDGSIFEMLKYSSAREQKQKLWEAWISKASLTTDENLVNNSPIIHVLRNLYQRYAEHLGFRSVPHLQLSTKMIGNPETLREFIASLYHRFRPVFLQRYEDWKNYADEEEGIPFGQLRPFDMFYICRREAEFYYDIDTLDLMNYFPSWKTFENLLAISRAFFGIEFKDITNENNCFIERCHHLIRIYQVTDLKTNKILGRIYVDPFSRPGKLINRWRAELWRTENYGMDKLVWLVGDMDEVKTNNKSCLHYEEIICMLKEFGRAIHLLVSESPYEWLAIPFESYSHEWDAANFMPTFVGFFINKPDLLLMLSSPHMESGQSLSHQKAQDIALALARGMFWDMWRTLFWTDYDLTLYEIEKAEDKHYLDLYKEMYQEYFPFPREPNNYQPCSFTPIFAMRSRPCLYYRKLWNEALALDVHETFEKEGNFSSTSARLKQIWLKNGALKSQWDMYQEFQGREPNILAMGNFYDPPSLRSLEEENRGIVAQIS